MFPHLSSFDAPWMIEIASKATLLLMLACLLQLVVRRGSAALQHRLWGLLFLGLLLLPGLQMLAPGWTWRILPKAWSPGPLTVRDTRPELAGVNDAHAASPPGTAMRPSVVEPATAGDGTGASPLRPTVFVAESPLAIAPPQASQPARLADAPRVSSSTLWLLRVWSIGFVLSVVPIAWGWLSLSPSRRRYERVTEPVWMRRVAALRRRLRLRRRVTVLLGDPEQMPVTFGLLRPCVLLPAHALRWSRNRFESVVLHELAHIKRWDVPLQLLARLACAVYWFHPLAWWALGRMRATREIACDDCVLSAGQEPAEYAASLLDVAREHRSYATYSAVALSMARRSQLEGRLLAVLEANRSRAPMTGRTASSLLALSLAVVTLLAIIRPASFADERPLAQTSVVSTSTVSAVTPLLQVTGVVLLPNGNPAAAAEVQVIAHRDRGHWIRSERGDATLEQFTARCDRSGRFQVSIPRDPTQLPRYMNILASLPGYSFAMARLDERLATIAVQLQLHESREIRIQLIDTIGNPVPGVDATLKHAVLADGEFVSAPHPDGATAATAWPTFSRSDAEGFTFIQLSKSTTNLAAIIDDPQVGAHMLQLEVGDEPIAAVLRPASFLTGKVTAQDTGKPVANAEIVVMEQPFRIHRTAKDGSFRIARGTNIETLFTDNQSIIHVYPPADSDYLFQALEWIWPSAGPGHAELAIALPKGIPVTGHVVERDSGTPVAGAKLRFESRQHGNPHFSRSLRSRFAGADMSYRTNEQGAFKLAVAPGPGLLLVSTPSLEYVHMETSMGEKWEGKSGMQREYYHGIVRLDLQPDAHPHPLKIELQRGQTIRRQVVRPDGTQAMGKAYTRSYLQTKNEVEHWLPEIPLIDGQWELPAFSPERSVPLFILDADGQCGVAITTAADVPKEGAPIRLQPSGSARFRFVTDQGKPLVDYQARLNLIFTPGAPNTHHIEHNQPLWTESVIWENVIRPARPPRTDADGRLTVSGLIPGARYNLTFVGKDGRFNQGYEFAVESGQTIDVGEVMIPERN